MNPIPETFSLDDMYSPLSLSDEKFKAIVTQSLNPRGPEMLFEVLETYGVDSTHYLLDIGSRDAAYACELARRFHCQVLAVDPVPYHRELAQHTITTANQQVRVTAREGRIEAIPAPAVVFDFIWCRDVLSHVSDLPTAFRECYRVLKPGGKTLIYTTVATALLEPAEAACLYPPLAIIASSMSAASLEAQWQQIGFRTLLREVIGSEWREHWEEEGNHRTATQLLKIARLQRNRAQLIAQLGEKPYATELADCYWGVYQMLGKLCPMLYIIERPDVSEPPTGF